MRILTLFFLAIFFSCSQPTAQKEQTIAWQNQLDKVMEVHDEVMPFTAEIVKLNKRLKNFQSTHPNLSKEVIDQLEDIQNQLTTAEEGMWDWMHGFVQPSNGDDVKKANLYLSNEQIKIQTVSENMKSSMKAAKQIISKLNIQ